MASSTAEADPRARPQRRDPVERRAAAEMRPLGDLEALTGDSAE
jgi:hypothetical protein